MNSRFVVQRPCLIGSSDLAVMYAVVNVQVRNNAWFIGLSYKCSHDVNACNLRGRATYYALLHSSVRAVLNGTRNVGKEHLDES